MRLRIKNFNIFGVYWSLKNPIFIGGHEKPIYSEGLPKKGRMDSLHI